MKKVFFVIFGVIITSNLLCVKKRYNPQEDFDTYMSCRTVTNFLALKDVLALNLIALQQISGKQDLSKEFQKTSLYYKDLTSEPVYQFKKKLLKHLNLL